MKLVILDRDGVINHDSAEFIKTPDEFVPIAGSIDAIADLSRAGFTVAVATNQSGLARDLFDEATLQSIHDKMNELVRAAGGEIDRIVYCPHHPDDDCDCRKPKPGLYEQLANHYSVELDGVPVVGDSHRDIAAAQSIHARPILVLTGNGITSAGRFAANGEQVETCNDLAAAAKRLIDEDAST